MNVGNIYGEVKTIWRMTQFHFLGTLLKKNFILKSFYKKKESGSKQDWDFQFIGIFAKNREEWVVTDLACIFNKIKYVPFYDTLGVNSVEFIINQTQLKCIWWTSDKIKLLTKLKKSNKIDSLEILIVYDEWDPEKAIKCPFKLVSTLMQ